MTAIMSLRYRPLLDLEPAAEPPPSLSASGPTISGPSRATSGHTMDIIRASSNVSPTASMCTGRNGNKHPRPVINNVTFQTRSLQCAHCSLLKADVSHTYNVLNRNSTGNRCTILFLNIVMHMQYFSELLGDMQLTIINPERSKLVILINFLYEDSSKYYVLMCHFMFFFTFLLTNDNN